MNPTYMSYQAQRTMSTAEQRAADRRAGELAKSLASLWHSVTALRVRRGILRGRHRSSPSSRWRTRQRWPSPAWTRCPGR